MGAIMNETLRERGEPGLTPAGATELWARLRQVCSTPLRRVAKTRMCAELGDSGKLSALPWSKHTRRWLAQSAALLCRALWCGSLLNSSVTRSHLYLYCTAPCARATRKTMVTLQGSSVANKRRKTSSSNGFTFMEAGRLTRVVRQAVQLSNAMRTSKVWCRAIRAGPAIAKLAGAIVQRCARRSAPSRLRAEEPGDGFREPDGGADQERATPDTPACSHLPRPYDVRRSIGHATRVARTTTETMAAYG